MIDNLIIEATVDTPAINFDISKGEFEIKGKSMPEDACEFYSPIKKWLKEYCKSPATSTTVSCKLDYFNSATARKLVEVFTVIECLKLKNAEIHWYYRKDDSIIFDKGQELDYLINLPFEFIEID